MENNLMNKFINEMKISIKKLEQEEDKDILMDMIDEIHYKVIDFQNEYCD